MGLSRLIFGAVPGFGGCTNGYFLKGCGVPLWVTKRGQLCVFLLQGFGMLEDEA